MLKVPRKWTQWIVNLIKIVPTRELTAVIYIGSDVVTLGYRGPRSRNSNGISGKVLVKKRLGSRSNASSLTQSLTLSHIHRILARLNSSASIAIILPNALFHRVNISGPGGLASQDIGPTLIWALEQQGFVAADWLWDAKIAASADTLETTYEVLLIETVTIEEILERLGISSRQVTRLIADTAVPTIKTSEVYGPWLDQTQAQKVLTLLHDATDCDQSLNPACNLIARISIRYRQALYQCTALISAVLFMSTTWWLSSMSTGAELVNNGAATLPSLPVIPTHPLFTHAHVWQQLHDLNNADIVVELLEFGPTGWRVQIRTQHPNLVDDWLKQLHERLNISSAHSAIAQPATAWRVQTRSSRSTGGSMLIELELNQ